jgi:F0F1-type ATP synthase membrane subunit c/vacuolar-type H+-ATPase subunit K
MLKKWLKSGLIGLLLVNLAMGAAKAQTETTRSLGQTTLTGSATMGVARLVLIDETDVKDGAVVTATEKGVKLSSAPYDSQVLGIVSRDAAIVFNSTGLESGVPVISYGQVYLLVSARDGEIKRGDLLTTSTLPGVAVKANKSGYVLGSAMEDFSSADSQQEGKIAVDLNLHYFNSKSPFPGSLTDIFKIALITTKEGPSALFKYIVAAIVVIGSFVLAFMTFGRTAAKGVEALGRNPSASRVIHLGIVFNVTIVVAIVLAGLTVAFLILRL